MQTSGHEYTFGQFRLVPSERELLHAGRPLAVPPKAFDLLVVLVENSGRTVTKDELIDALWAETCVEEGNLHRLVSVLRRALSAADGDSYIETRSKHGYRFVARVTGAPAPSEPRPAASAEPPVEDVAGAHVHAVGSEPDGGAVPLGSTLYVERAADRDMAAAVRRRDSILLVKGPRQIGKTSLLARCLHRARSLGARVAVADLQALGEPAFASADTLLRTLARSLALQLDVDAPDARWDSADTPAVNFERFLVRSALGGDTAPLVWGLDEVDRLLACPFANDVFGLVRSWHNRRALDPAAPWGRLTIALAYATEAQLFITDLNQSPFNVGTRLDLSDFTPDEVAELDRRYGSPLGGDDGIGRLVRLVGGHPYLVQRSLGLLARGTALDELERTAERDDGPFGTHLRRMLLALSKSPDLCEAVRDVLRGRERVPPEAFYRLHGGGVLSGECAAEARPRCGLYAAFLARHLL